jgi:FKBP-type peptidyl-prolyl cis-trans isomerase
MGVSKETVTDGDGVNYPKQGDELTMHYTGTLVSDGSKFDSSVDKGRPFVFKIGLGMVIRGWDEGVMAMSLGEKAVLTITSDFGYGASTLRPRFVGEVLSHASRFTLCEQAALAA